MLCIIQFPFMVFVIWDPKGKCVMKSCIAISKFKTFTSRHELQQQYVPVTSKPALFTQAYILSAKLHMLLECIQKI